MPKVSSYKFYISRLIYPLSGNTLLKYKVHSHVKYCAILHSDFNHDTSVVLIVYFFLVYESYTFTRHHLICKTLTRDSKRKKAVALRTTTCWNRALRLWWLKKGKTKRKSIKSRKKTSKISTIRKTEEDRSTEELKVGNINIFRLITKSMLLV